MRIVLFFFGAFFLFTGCNSKKQESVVPAGSQTATQDSDTSNFFPVTIFIKGQIADIKNIGITPIRKIIKDGRVVDSSFVKPEDYIKVFADFLSPVIDSVNVKTMFTENKFMDQTLNTFTFTYDPKNSKADSFAFSHWDVYVDPESQKVKSVYLVKKTTADKQLQLTWKTGKSCSIVTVNTGANSGIEKQEKISWTYDE